MSKNIDLIKILKNCPKGTKLYSTIFGEVEFVECDDLYQIVVTKEDKYYYFTSEGVFIFERIKYNLGECCLFPSREIRDWNKFTIPWHKKEKFDPKTLQPFDKVLVRIFKTAKWRCEHFSYFTEGYDQPYMASTSYIFCVPYNDDTKHLVGTDYKAPEFYRYWED